MCVVEPNLQLSTKTLPLLSASTATDKSSAQVNAHNSPKVSSTAAKSAKQTSKLLTKQEETKLLDEKLCDFFFGCDIPFAVVESTNFRNLVAALRPSYASKLPSRQKLATELLDAACNRCVADNLQRLHNQPSVLVIDEWLRGEYGPCNMLVALLQNAGTGDERVFLRARHATNDDDNDFYTAFLDDSLRAAHQTYDTAVYAVVSDRVADPGAIKAPDAIWYSPCQLGLANALAQDIFDQELDEKVTFVLRQFKRTIWHKALMEVGGQPVRLPKCDSWRSYHESYVNFAQNAPFMKMVVDDATFEPDSDSVSQRELTQDLLSNRYFLESVEEHASVLEPVCQLIETCGRSNASLADAAHAWLEARVDENDQFRRAFERRRNAALTKYALTAYFLHPKRTYYERSTQMARATKDDQQKAYFLVAQSFLLELLDADGIEAFDNFQNGLGIVKTLLAKNVENATVFWRMVKPHHPQMADLALRLLRIPASASRVDRQFYRRSYAHDALAAAVDDNPVAFERCEKLLRIYYSRRSADIASPEF